MDGAQIVRDDEGAEFDSPDAAVQAAVRAATEIGQGRLARGETSNVVIEVRDERSPRVCTIESFDGNRLARLTVSGTASLERLVAPVSRCQKEPGAAPGSCRWDRSIKRAADQRLTPWVRSCRMPGYTPLRLREKYQIAAATMITSRMIHQ